MDGSLAVIFIVIGLMDMNLNYCATGCLSQTFAPARFTGQVSQVFFQSDDIAREIYLGYDLPRAYGPFRPTLGGSLSSENDVWIGFGAKWTTQSIIDSPFFFEASLMPGLFTPDDGPNLGGSLQFRSALGLGYTFGGGNTLSVLWDHRSNGDTQELNPGLETLSIRYAVTLD